MSTDHFDEHVRRIAKSFHEGKVAFFIGAGVPKAEAKLPLFGELAVMLLRAFERDYPDLTWCNGLLVHSADGNTHLVDGVLPEQVAEVCLHQNQDLVKRTLYENLMVGNVDGASYKAIRDLANDMKGRLDIIYTTNFDNTIERFLGARAISISTEEEWGYKSEMPGVKVIHLNGFIEEGNFKISEADLYGVRLLTDPLYHRVVNHLYENTMVFVGYGLRDPGINLLFSISGKIIGKKGPHFAIYPSKYLGGDETTAQSMWDFLRSFWEKRGVTLLDAEPGQFFEKLVREVLVLEWESELDDIGNRRSDLTRDDIILMVTRMANQSTISEQDSIIAYLKHLL